MLTSLALVSASLAVARLLSFLNEKRAMLFIYRLSDRQFLERELGVLQSDVFINDDTINTHGTA
jgi:hypothetical protein